MRGYKRAMFCNNATFQLHRSLKACEAGKKSIPLEAKVIGEMLISISSDHKDVKQPLAVLRSSR